MGVRDLRWIFLIPNRTKHLPADGLALTPLRWSSKIDQQIDQKNQDKFDKNPGMGLAQNNVQADVLVLNPKLKPTSLNPFLFDPIFVAKNV